MSRLILLDASPLGMAVNARRRREFSEWFSASRPGLVVPEIADYEVRRERLRAGLLLSLRRLDALVFASQYQSLSTVIVRRAARLWAETRQVAADG